MAKSLALMDIAAKLVARFSLKHLLLLSQPVESVRHLRLRPTHGRAQAMAMRSLSKLEPILLIWSSCNSTQQEWSGHSLLRGSLLPNLFVVKVESLPTHLVSASCSNTSLMFSKISMQITRQKQIVGMWIKIIIAVHLNFFHAMRSHARSILR